MKTEPLPWTHHRTISGLYFAAVIVFAVTALLALAVARLEHLFPDARVMSPSFFGQLLGLHRILLFHFVLAPALSAVLGLGLLPGILNLRSMAFPRLALASWCLFVAGGVFILWSFLGVGVDLGWMHAVASAGVFRSATVAMLLGLLLCCVALQLVAVTIIATVQSAGWRRAPLFAQALHAAAWMQTLMTPLYASALVLGILQRFPALSFFEVARGGDAALLPLLVAFASAPLSPMLVLGSLGALCAALRPEQNLPRAQVRRMGYLLVAMAVLGLLSFDARILPSAISARIALFGSFHKALWLIPVLALLASLFEAALAGLARWSAARIYALGALLLMMLAAPLDAFLGLPSASYFAAGYLGSVSDYLLAAGGTLLAVLAALSETRAGRSPARETLGMVAGLIVLFGLMASVLPMVPMGMNGLAMELADYPAAQLPLQVLVLAGGTLFAGGLVLAALALPGAGGSRIGTAQAASPASP